MDCCRTILNGIENNKLCDCLYKPKIELNNHNHDYSIDLDSINVFGNDFDKSDKKNKKNNDYNNKIREKIIEKVWNKTIPQEYYVSSEKWKKIKFSIDKYTFKLLEKNTKICKSELEIVSLECHPKAGRKHNYDFDLKIKYFHIVENDKVENDIEFKIEFKYGATCVSDCPQFSSPSNPSRFLNRNYEEFHYDEILPKISELANLPLPDREIYLKSIHNNIVECMSDYKKMYDSDKNFNKKVKVIDKESIKEFLTLCELDITKLSEYLLKSQKDKNYMCYENNDFHYDKIDENFYKIKSVIQIKSPNIICETENGYKIEIKLRWKNGNGIQFPAFQIQRKIPLIKDLHSICKKFNIIPPRLKKDILKALDKENILY